MSPRAKAPSQEEAREKVRSSIWPMGQVRTCLVRDGPTDDVLAAADGVTSAQRGGGEHFVRTDLQLAVVAVAEL